MYLKGVPTGFGKTWMKMNGRLSAYEKPAEQIVLFEAFLKHYLQFTDSLCPRFRADERLNCASARLAS